MSQAIEVLYGQPVDITREDKIAKTAAKYGGTLTSRDGPTDVSVSGAISLIVEFKEWPDAERAAAELRKMGEHVEGPVSYGDD